MKNITTSKDPLNLEAQILLLQVAVQDTEGSVPITDANLHLPMPQIVFVTLGFSKGPAIPAKK